MPSISQTIRDTASAGHDSYYQGIFALVFFVIIILAYSFAGLTLPFYLALIACALAFFLPSSDYLGLVCIAGLTMIFEKIFGLQPLIIGDTIYKVYPIDALMVSAFIALIINIAVYKKRKFGWPEWVLVIFFAIVSLNMVRGLMDINAEFATAFSSFKNYLWYPLIYFLALYSVNTKEKLKNFVKMIMLFAIVLIGFIAYGFINGQGLWTEYTPLSTEGTRILASTHAFYLSMAIIMAFSLLIAQRFRNAIFSMFIMLIWLVGIIGSQMRHLWLGLAISLGALFVFSPNKDKKNLSSIFFKAVIVVIAIFLLAILASNLLPTNNASGSISSIIQSTRNRATSLLYTGDDSSVSWRMGLWRDALNQWQINPILGIGFGKQLSLETYDFQALEDVKNIHNSPLAILVQTGILGFATFALFILAVFLTSIKYIFKDEELRPYYVGILCALILFLFSSLFQPYLETNITSIFLWLLLGLLATSRFINKNPNENTSDK